jgi:hypothetical protein
LKLALSSTSNGVPFGSTMNSYPYKQTKTKGWQKDEAQKTQNIGPLKHKELQIDLSNCN